MGMTSAFHGPGWHEIARTRVRDVGVALLFAAFIALSGVLAAGGGAWPFLWFVAAVATQGLSLLVTEPMRRDPHFQVSARRETIFFLTVALGAVTFAASGALFWLAEGRGWRMFAVMLLAGGAVNVALKPGLTTRMLWLGCAPFLILLQALPLLSLFFVPVAQRGVMGVATAAAALFGGHLVLAARRSIANSRRLAVALQRARRERRRADAAHAEKNDFLGLMSHELRTPLNGVLGMAQAMGVEPLTPEQRDRLEVIRDSGEILRVLLNDVLGVSDIEAAAPGDPEPAPEPAPVAGPGWSEHRLRVLAAEDNLTNQLVLRTLLDQAGIEVHVVDDGAAAVEAWRTAHWDVLLMDIRMPGMDGLAATRVIRAAEAAEGRPRTPIIAVSAEASVHQAADYRAAGMDSFVPKPIQFAQLAAAIAAALGASGMRSGHGAAHG